VRISENITAFERLLAHNRKATIIWQHAGWDNTGSRSVQLMRRLLDDHPNLFLGLKMSPTSLFKKNDPIQRGAGLKPDWRALIAAHPDRFVLGSDYFAPAPHFNRRRPPNLQPGLRIIELLPAGLKRKVAYENARRLYRLHGRHAQ
jgi:predicted TIM-barrel fold metal-dependent hydrolase